MLTLSAARRASADSAGTGLSAAFSTLFPFADAGWVGVMVDYRYNHRRNMDNNSVLSTGLAM
jgi:hypothetical protein